jgi:carboxylesterase
MNQSSKPQEDIELEGGEHCVLMLHGLGASPLELSRLAKDLHLAGFSVYAPNTPNYSFGYECGHSAEWIAQAQQYVWTLRKRYKSVSVVGLSMGATLAMALAGRENLTSIVLLSTALAYDGWAIPWYNFLIHIAKWLPFANRYRYAEAEPFGVKNPEMRATIKRALKNSHISESGADYLSFNYVSEGISLIKEARKKAHLIDCPTLFIHAVDDETVHMRNVESVFKAIRSATKNIIYLGDSYHMITVDNERETVNQETARFLKTQVNAAFNSPVFDVPSPQTPELRRLLRQRLRV